MSDPNPQALELSRLLASVYGHSLDEPLTYPTGVALSGRLRLARVVGDVDAVAAEIEELTEPFVANPDIVPAAGPCLAVACFADELFSASNDLRHRDLILSLTNRLETDPDIRVEDFFFSGTLLGRAYGLTGEQSLADRLALYLLAADTQQASGLYWHCHASPYLWGRGNAFAALGYAEALSYLGDHAAFAALLDRHLRHLRALAAHQDDSGLWHQVVDDRHTYLEHSATTMIGYAIARGINRGWLTDEWRSVVERTWDGARARIGADGSLEHVCVGTGPLATLDDYVTRPFSDDLDARGGAMALWFATEMIELAT